MEIRLHPDVKDYLRGLEGGEQRCKETLRHLKDDPFRSRPKCDIKKLQGCEKTMYRLRVGEHRFEYFIEDDVVWVVEAFRRGRGYR